MAEFNNLNFECIQALARLHNLKIEYDQYKEKLISLQEYHLEGAQAKTSHCYALVGDTGTSKSTLIRQLIRLNTDDKGYCSILPVEVPEQCTVKHLASATLEMLGDPLYSKGTRFEMDGRIFKLLKEVGIQTIIFDEFQHFLSSENLKHLFFSANWVKTLGNKSGVTIIFAGLPEALDIFQHNGQLKRRNRGILEMRPFSWNNDRECEDALMLLHVIDRALPFASKSAIVKPPCDRMLIQASGGSIVYIMPLVIRATKEALRRADDNLEDHHLAVAYDELGGPPGIRLRDPFGPVPDYGPSVVKVDVSKVNERGLFDGE